MQIKILKYLSWVITLIVSFTTISCQANFSINEVIDQNAPFTLRIKTIDPKTGISTYKTELIEINTEKWNKLLEFAKDNLAGWQPSPASYIGDVTISQGDFRLLLLQTKGSDSIVISFKNKNEKPKQYLKTINKGELDFLTE